MCTTLLPADRSELAERERLESTVTEGPEAGQPTLGLLPSLRQMILLGEDVGQAERESGIGPKRRWGGGVADPDREVET